MYCPQADVGLAHCRTRCRITAPQQFQGKGNVYNANTWDKVVAILQEVYLLGAKETGTYMTGSHGLGPCAPGIKLC